MTTRRTQQVPGTAVLLEQLFRMFVDHLLDALDPAKRPNAGMMRVARAFLKDQGVRVEPGVSVRDQLRVIQSSALPFAVPAIGNPSK